MESQPEAATPSRLRRWLGLELLDNRYPSLHGLRVLAVLTVVQFHVTWILSAEQGVRLDREFAEVSLAIFFGMDLFFILSGFLIGSILMRSLDRAGTTELRRFYLRRVFRTFPSYYVVLTLLALWATAAQRERLAYEYLYLTNFMPLGRGGIVMFWGWSLALEEQFYLVVPLLVLLLYRVRDDRSRIALLGGLWALGTIVRLAIFLGREQWTDLDLYGALYFKTYTRFDTLLCGILLALVHRRYGARISTWLETPRHRAYLALPALSCLWVLMFPTVFGPEYLQWVHVFAWGTLTCVMYFCTLILLLHAEGPIGRWLSRPIFRQIATLGYGVYLVHIPIIDHVIVPAARALQERHVSQIVIWTGGLAGVMLLSLAVSWVLHVLVEKPSLRLRDRVAG